MTAGYSTTFADLLAEWGHDPSCSSKTCQGCLLQTTGTLWPESFTDWPQSATASPGGLWQQQPLEPLIDGFAGGDLPTLPTPTASQPGGTAEQHLAHKNKNGGNRTAVTDLGMVVTQLLPTPLSRDWKDGKESPNVPVNGILSREVWNLLPTPTAQAAKHGSTRDLGANRHGHNL